MVAYLKFGPEFVANDFTEEGQEEVRVTSLSNGNFVVTWRNEGGVGNDVVARLFNPNGHPIGDEIHFADHDAANQQNAYVTALDGGGFVIAWQDANNTDYADDATGNAVRAQIFNAAGQEVGTQILVNTTTAGAQQAPQIAAVNGGGFFVTWQDASATGGDTTGTAIRGQLFNADGTKVIGSSELLINTSTANNQTTPTTTRLLNGNIVVSWVDASTDTTNTDIRARIYDPAGNAIGAADFLIDTNGAPNAQPAITALSNGTFAVTWRTGATGAGEISARIFDAFGNPVSAEFQVNVSTTGDQLDANIVATADGFIVAWRDANTATDGSGIALPAAYFDNFGHRLPWGTANGQYFGDLLIPTETLNNQRAVLGGGGITMLANGDLVFSFDDTSHLPPDTDDESARFQIYRSYADKYGTASGDTLKGTGARDFLVGFGGNDKLNGGNGDDVLDGGIGADTLNGGKGKDTASYASASAGVTVNLNKASANTGDAHGDKFIGIENLLGSRFADTLIGDKGANVLDGGDGDDILIGGAGKDTLIGGHGTDTASYASAKAGVELSLAEGGESGDAKGDTYYSIENVIGSKFADTIEGDDGTNTIDGGAGNDHLAGGGGNDELFGGDGNDTLFGDNGPGDDDEEEDDDDDAGGNDILHGGAGNDVLVGGKGADTLEGGTGKDSFVFNFADEGGDTITDFSHAEGDQIHISAEGFGHGLVAGTALVDGTTFLHGAGDQTATGSNGQFLYNETTGVLSWDDDGAGSDAAVVIATLTGAPALVTADFNIVA